jgi:hypothetical protein
VLILKRPLFAILILALLALSPPAFSQDAAPENAEKDSAFSSNIYGTPTFEKLSKMYWALNKFDTAEDPKFYVEDYLKINECDLFKQFGHNEFDWNKIKDTTYEFLQKNKQNFSTHVSILMPLHFEEYDFEKKAFKILDESKIQHSQKFEVIASDFQSSLCGERDRRFIPGYPHILQIQLSRPFELSHVPMTSDAAESYIKKKTPKFLELREEYKTKNNLYLSRDAYLVMKVNIFHHKKDVIVNQDTSIAMVQAILDRYEIYEDPDRKILLYAKDVNVKRPQSQGEKDLKKKYQERLKENKNKPPLTELPDPPDDPPAETETSP